MRECCLGHLQRCDAINIIRLEYDAGHLLRSCVLHRARPGLVNRTEADEEKKSISVSFSSRGKMSSEAALSRCAPVRPVCVSLYPLGVRVCVCRVCSDTNVYFGVTWLEFGCKPKL